MDKLNAYLIKTKKKLNKANKKIEKLQAKAKLYQDTLHLNFDSSNVDTRDTERFIIGDFWADAYKQYKDGGFITNDPFIPPVRFAYEIELIEKIINKHCNQRERVIDICCGNGRYTHEFAKHFDSAIGLDLSTAQIKDNIRQNNNKNLRFINADFMEISTKEYGQFDFVFASDVFTYTDKSNINKMLDVLLRLVKKDGILLLRESTYMVGYNDYKSCNYVAYYRNSKFYEKGIFKPYFVKSYRNYAYNLYHLDKYFNVYKGAREKVAIKPNLLKGIVKSSIDVNERTGHFYVLKK